MKQWMLCALVMTLTTTAGAASQDVLEETLYQQYTQAIYSNNPVAKSLQGFSKFDQSLYVDALWDALEEAPTKEALKSLDGVQAFYYDLAERLRIGILRIRYQRAVSLPGDVSQDLYLEFRKIKPNTKIIYLLAAYESELTQAGHGDIIRIASTFPEYSHVANDTETKKEITNEIVGDLWNNLPDVSTYMNGEYAKSVKLYLFCRSNRLFPCLMVMRDPLGQPYRAADGSLWTQPALASSKKGLPSYIRNGNTPVGIFTIDSVMPVADAQISFGKFRRLILNFPPKSKDEVLFKSLLPQSSRSTDWWRGGIVARDAGRNLFRIHGTGKLNTDPNVPYFPFMRTSGCVAQRENTYDGITYQDQRILLDSMMKAMGLDQIYANEPQIKGILYVVEIDDREAPVELTDLTLRGIE